LNTEELRMKNKGTVSTTRISQKATAAALAAARENVKVAKKRVKDAKTALKSARTDLKAAKRARKVAEARREAEAAKRTPRKRKSAAVSAATAVARGAPRLRKISVRRMRITPASTSIDATSLAPVDDTALGADLPPEGALPTQLDSGHVQAN
jgi:hypothetical protein